jgi:peptide-methionine (S)-S-oxide reductase
MLVSLVVAAACAGSAGHDTTLAPVPPAGPGQEVAVFAGGCFWCMEADFDKLKGVVHTTSGYIAGNDPDPTYEEVGAGRTGHTEAVRVVYDPAVVTYERVLDWFWHHVDPTDASGQFCDRGSQYRTGIYPVDTAQQRAAEASKKAIDASGVLPSRIVTEILAGQTFHPAEIYHQDFHVTSPGRYLPYRSGCGRDARVAEVWKKAP